jgi:hypothetical protein
MACCRTGAKARNDGDGNWELLPFDGETSTGKAQESDSFPVHFQMLRDDGEAGLPGAAVERIRTGRRPKSSKAMAMKAVRGR